MKYFSLFALAAALCCALIAFPSRPAPTNVPHTPANAVYYWRTTFNPDSAEMKFLADNNVRRMYIRYFDVVAEDLHLTGRKEVIPNATIRFDAPVPESVESVVPTVYITIDALRESAGKEQELAGQIVRRVLNMSSYNEVNRADELQLDCDWTESTRESYFTLCRAVRDSLSAMSKDPMRLSSTIRLHQLRQDAPPVDYGVLMVYNTGSFLNPDTRNSILDYDDVEPYLRKEADYSLPLDVAYPTYEWTLSYRNGKFLGIVRDTATVPDSLKGDRIRTESADFATISRVKELIDSRIPAAANGRSNILYHLDSKQLSTFSPDEINKIYSRSSR